jgi:hypothetical protein
VSSPGPASGREPLSIISESDSKEITGDTGNISIVEHRIEVARRARDQPVVDLEASVRIRPVRPEKRLVAPADEVVNSERDLVPGARSAVAHDHALERPLRIEARDRSGRESGDAGGNERSTEKRQATPQSCHARASRILANLTSPQRTIVTTIPRNELAARTSSTGGGQEFFV